MATIPSGQSSLPSASFVTQAEAEAAAEQPPQTRGFLLGWRAGGACLEAMQPLQHATPSCDLLSLPNPRLSNPPFPLTAGAIVARADGRRIQRAYEFAVDVAAGPPDSMFR